MNVKIALDAMGGDFAPRATVEGAVTAARELGLEVVLVGDRDLIQRELSEHATKGLKLTVEHAAEVVAMDESPIEAVLSKPHSSLHLCYELMKRGEVGAVISAGNSGAMMTIGIALMGNLAGIDRPAIASLVPSLDEVTLLIDAGANTEVKAANLAQFAAMGSAYMRHLRGIPQPRVALLSNGEEDSKGNELTRSTAALLRQTGAVNYVGYLEGRDLHYAKADVIVSDGFTGNVALKTAEGTARFALSNLREIFTTSVRGRLSYLLIRRRLAALRARLEPSEYGGAPLLGLNGAAFIAHGSSNALAIRNALRVAANGALGEAVNREIVVLMAQLAGNLALPPPNKGFRALFSRMRERLQRRSREGEAARPAAREGEDVSAPARATGSLKSANPAKDTGSLKTEPEADHATARQVTVEVMPRTSTNGTLPNKSAPAELAPPAPATPPALTPPQTPPKSER